MSIDPRAEQFVDVLKDFIAKHTEQLRVCMPAKVVEYYPEEMRVDVQPLPKVIFPGMKLADMMEFPIIYAVPLQWPRVDAGGDGPKAIMYMPIKKESNVLLVFSDLSLDNFTFADDGTKTYDPQDVRRHDLTDAIAIPGIMPFAHDVPAADSSKGSGGPRVDPSDIRIVLEWKDRNIKSEIYLGGDTGDAVVYPQNIVRLGHPKADRFTVPQQELKDWLIALTTLFEDYFESMKTFLTEMKSFKDTAGDTFDPAAIAHIQTMFVAAESAKDNIANEIMAKFDTDFGVICKKVRIAK